MCIGVYCVFISGTLNILTLLSFSSYVEHGVFVRLLHLVLSKASPFPLSGLNVVCRTVRLCYTVISLTRRLSGMRGIGPPP